GVPGWTAAAGLRRGPHRWRSVRVGAMGSASGAAVHVGVGTDAARLPEALLVLFRVADRRTGAAPARRRSRRPRDRRAAPSRISIHRARRRQLLSGHVRRSGAGAAPSRFLAAARAPGAARRALRADGEARRHGIHVLGSFIFGLNSDTKDTFDATVALAERADLTFAQFVLLTPFPGTVDFDKWAAEESRRGTTVDGVPITQHWLIPEGRRPKLYAAHPTMSLEEIRVGTQRAWDRFYGWRHVWARSSVVETVRARIAFVLISKLYRHMYANTGIATDSARVQRST